MLNFTFGFQDYRHLRLLDHHQRHLRNATRVLRRQEATPTDSFQTTIRRLSRNNTSDTKSTISELFRSLLPSRLA